MQRVCLEVSAHGLAYEGRARHALVFGGFTRADGEVERHSYVDYRVLVGRLCHWLPLLRRCRRGEAGGGGARWRRPARRAG
jgi:hypothetical protein